MQFKILVKGTSLSTYLKKMPVFLRDYAEIKKQAKENNLIFPLGKLYPCLEEANQDSGTTSGHYFHQDLLVAGKIFQNNPVKHVDIGSRIDGFVAHVASFREIEVFDIRALPEINKNIHFRRFNFTDENFSLQDYCDSLSCLHALEHFGLGRYGDKINYNGHLIGWKNIYGMLKKGGKLYFSVPIGSQRIEFNAHRVFSVKYLLGLMENKYRIDSFSYVRDDGSLIRDAALAEDAVAGNFSCNYGCGIFELTKQ